jgi:hypothetical protein
MSNETLTARRNKPFVSSLRAWIGFLTRPRRSTFPDSFVRRYALWLMIAIILVAASMIALDQWTINAVAKLPAWVNRGFKQLTDFGRSGWFLVPLGSCILALAAILVLDAFDVARARGLHRHRGSGVADTARLPLEGLSAFGGGRKDCKTATGRYPPHVGPVGMRFSVPDLRASVPAHGKLS